MRKQLSPLDVNLISDRTIDTVSEISINLENVPEEVPFGSMHDFKIEGFNEFWEFEVSAEHGTTVLNEDTIRYVAPPTAQYKVDTISVTVTVNPDSTIYMYGTRGFENDYIIDGAGQITFIQEVLDIRGTPLSVVQRFEAMRDSYHGYMNAAKASVTVKPMVGVDYENNSMESNSFKIEEKFKEYTHLESSWKEKPPLSGGTENYNVPADTTFKSSWSDPNRNRETVLPNVEIRNGTPFMLFKPRNSNIDEAAGNVNDGYRYQGAIGSSLGVKKEASKTKIRFDFEINIGLYDLEAVIPKEILSLCITSLSVESILRGNPEGHTFLWEQISGDTSEIFWESDPTDKDLAISIGQIKVDREFRLWISKGTKYEKSYVLLVYGTPSDTVNTLPLYNEHNFSNVDVNQGTSSHHGRPIVITAPRLWVNDMKIRFIDKVR